MYEAESVDGRGAIYECWLVARGRVVAERNCEICCIKMVRQRDYTVFDVGDDWTCESGT